MRGAAHTLVFRADDVPAAAALAPRVRALLPPDQGLAVLEWQELMPGLDQLIRMDKAEGWFIYAALILVVTLSITNTFLMAVLERTREFGILLALGMKPLRIGALVMLESLLLVLLGLLLGLLLGGAVTGWLAVEGLTWPGVEEFGAEFNFPDRIYPQVSLTAFLLGPSGILLFTMVAALYPALRIRRLRPVEAINSV